MKRLLPFLITILAAILLVPVCARAAETDTQTQEYSQVLLVCDENNGCSRLEELILACGKSVDSVSEIEYRVDMLADYNFLVTTANEPYRDAASAGIRTICVGENAGPVDCVGTGYQDNTQINLRFAGHTQTVFVKSALFASALDGSIDVFGYMETTSGKVSPFAVIGPNAAYVPWYEEYGLPFILLGGLIQYYFDEEEDSAGRMYVLLDEVYVYSDLDMLRQTADMLHDNGIPFIVRIMPIYDNLDYPAFQRFTQALLYAQSKGGSIVLHDWEYESESETLETELTRATTAFDDAGITLLEMDFPPLAITLEDIHSIDRTKVNFGELPINTMITYQLFETSDELEQAVHEINAAWLSLSSYKAKYSIVDCVYTEKTIDANFIFRQDEQTNLKNFFSGASKILLIIVFVCSLIIIILLLVGRRIYRRKFYKR